MTPSADYYPPGTRLDDPHLSGTWRCTGWERCGSVIGDGMGACDLCSTDTHAADHCERCCTREDDE